MNYRSLVLTIAALSTAHLTTANAQSVYVAPGGVYIGGGPVYVMPAPSNGNGTYVEPTYGYGNGVPAPSAYLAPTVVAPGAGYVVAPYGANGNGNGYGNGNGNGNGNGYGYGYRNGYGPPRPPVYYNGDPVLSSYASSRVPRPPAAIPYNGNGRCIAGPGYGRCY